MARATDRGAIGRVSVLGTTASRTTRTMQIDESPLMRPAVDPKVTEDCHRPSGAPQTVARYRNDADAC